tara:strand:+ start:18 stop:359 length:342 start_codon:yes stop_codon:yes gene_type:complete
MSKNIKEKDIQNAILDYLTVCPGRFWTNASTGIYDPVKKCFRRTPRHFVAGVSDILGVLPCGTFVAIEVKTPKGRLSENQKQFLKDIQECNGIAFVARSVDDVRERLHGQARD